MPVIITSEAEYILSRVARYLEIQYVNEGSKSYPDAERLEALRCAEAIVTACAVLVIGEYWMLGKDFSESTKEALREELDSVDGLRAALAEALNG